MPIKIVQYHCGTLVYHCIDRHTEILSTKDDISTKMPVKAEGDIITKHLKIYKPMKKIFLLLSIFVTITVAQAKATEHYLKIKINNRSDIETLTQIVSIDNVSDNIVFAFANDDEFQALKKSGFAFEELLRPSLDPTRVINMATTVDQMSDWDRYPTYEVYVQMMQNWATNYPNLCKLDTIGNSIQGRQLLAVKISDNAAQSEAEPQLLYTSTMHGDETTGMILLMRLIDYLLVNYGTNERVNNIVDNMELYISPNTNPDGTYHSGNHTVVGATRYNSAGVDLNRNFPDPRVGTPAVLQTETTHMMRYAQEHNFILAANLHGGVELVNFPWDTWTSSQNKHADHNWFSQICRTYATLAQQNSPSGYMTGQNNGITHGGDWYIVPGGRQDYMNYFHNCREITIEVSNTKLLSTDMLTAHWNYNHESLLTHIETVGYGIHGIVTSTTKQPLDAKITVIGHDKDNSHVVTNPLHGNFYRMLMPGTYNLKIESYGYLTQEISNIQVVENGLVEMVIEMVPATTCTLTGTVIDPETGLPIEGVDVEVSGTPLPLSQTNAGGEFEISGILEGTYNVELKKSGYTTRILELNIGQEIEHQYVILSQSDEISFEDSQIPAEFTFEGDTPWEISTEHAYEGTHSIKSGAIGNSKTTTMKHTFTTDQQGYVEFYIKVSTEYNYDKLTFYIDNEFKEVLSGNIDWRKCTYPVSEGEHTLKWSYNKDASTTSGSDAVWVDCISLPKNLTGEVIAYITPRPVVVITEEAISTQDLYIRNLGANSFSYNATVEDQTTNNWLTLENNIGTIEPNSAESIKLKFDFSTVSKIMHNTNIVMDIETKNIVVPVSVNYTVGIDNRPMTNIDLYPNPATDQITLKVNNISGKTTLAVYTITGLKLSETQVVSEETNLELSKLGITNQGLFLLSLQSEKDIRQVKLMVQQ